jgi:hypothetical protein
MTQEEGASIGAALTAEPCSYVDRRMWYVGEQIPELDSPLAWKSNMWDPGKRVSMIKVAFSRDDAITNAVIDLAMDSPSDTSRAPPRLFEFMVRLDAVLDLSTTGKLAKYGLTMPMIASFHDIEGGLQRMPFANSVLRDRLKMLAGSAREFHGSLENGTRIEKVMALACALTFDGVLVSSSWHGGKDLLVFYSGWPGRVLIAHDTIEDVRDHGIVDLQTTRRF